MWRVDSLRSLSLNQTAIVPPARGLAYASPNSTTCPLVFIFVLEVDEHLDTAATANYSEVESSTLWTLYTPATSVATIES